MLRDVLGVSIAYRAFGRAIGARDGRRTYVTQYIRPKARDRILDVGCGPGDILEALPDVTYHGFDANAAYVIAARQRFGSRATFAVQHVSRELTGCYSDFDIVLANGILHHLDDEHASALFAIANAALKPGGVLVTLDGCYTPTQSTLAKILLNRDRGRFVRTRDEYVRLAKATFADVEPHVCSNLLRIPYTHLIMRCTKRAHA
jgi:2-polyprenyl-3-methyl-5-hydroxy-6-metoxy-1,4-benzoquinol methylase